MVGSTFNITRILAGPALLLILAATLLPALPAGAVYQAILYEDWERDGFPPFPYTSNGNTWIRFPDPPLTPTWDAEFGAIYHYNGNLNDNTSIWCAGTDQSLQSGEDSYVSNMGAFLCWGPFDLSDANSANGLMWYWCEKETNILGGGDMFYLGVMQGGPSPQLAAWDFLLADSTSGTQDEWRAKQFDFGQVINGATGDTTESYLGMNNLYIGLIFTSDFNNPPGGDGPYRGAFIDEISFGKDDGQYDFVMDDIYLFDPDDPNVLFEHMFVGVPVGLGIDFIAYGMEESAVVNHTLYANNNNVSEVTDSWLGTSTGETYSMPFPQTYVPSTPGQMTLTVLLDSGFEQPEASEANNDTTITVQIFPPNTPPTMTWIQPDDDGIQVPADAEVVELVYEAYNEPDIEQATISFYYDWDADTSNGFNSIPGLLNLPVINGPDTRFWYLDGFPIDTTYHVLAILEDGDTEPVFSYAPGTVFYGTAVETDATAARPDEFGILSAYPNPFNPTVEVSFGLPAPSEVEAAWYSVDGREVQRQELGRLNPGEHRFSWTPSNLPSGVYLLQLSSRAGTAMQKVTYLK